MLRFFLKNKIIVLSFALFVFSSSSVFAQLNLKSKLGASVSKSVHISFELPMFVESDFANLDEIHIKPSDNFEQTKKQPAMMMVSGLVSEVMINMEEDRVSFKSGNGDDLIVDGFDIVENGAGKSVMVSPTQAQSSFFVPVGGVLRGDFQGGQSYQGMAIVYVNFI
jgi:hypothetical protein